MNQGVGLLKQGVGFMKQGVGFRKQSSKFRVHQCFGSEFRVWAARPCLNLAQGFSNSRAACLSVAAKCVRQLAIRPFHGRQLASRAIHIWQLASCAICAAAPRGVDRRVGL